MNEKAEKPQPEKGVNWRRWLVQAAVSFAVLAALFWWLPTDDILEGISGVPPFLFAGVVLLFLAAHLFATVKWWLLTGRGVAAATAVRAHFAGLAANLCLPGVAGGDAARIAVAWPSAKDRSRLAAGSISDRLIDLIALCCIALIGLMFADGADAGLALRVLPLALVLSVLALWIGPWILSALWSVFPRLPAKNFVRKACDAASQIGRRPLFLAAMLLTSILIQGALILLALQLAKATGVDVPIAAWAFAWAVAKLIVVLPVSLGGLGVREALLAALLVPHGAAAADVVAGGLAWQAVLFVAGGLGGLLLVTSHKVGTHRKDYGSEKGQST